MSIDFIACWQRNAAGDEVVSAVIFTGRRDASPVMTFQRDETVCFGITAEALARIGQGQIVHNRIIATAAPALVKG